MSKLARWKTKAEVKAHRKAEALYQRSPEQVKKRENRNLARNTLEREGKAKPHDGKDIEHVNGDALDNRASNWKVGSRHKNRSYPRKSNASKLYKSS